MFDVRYFMSILAFAIVLIGEKRAGCFTLFAFLVSSDCCVALPYDATGLSVCCDCGISCS